MEISSTEVRTMSASAIGSICVPLMKGVFPCPGRSTVMTRKWRRSSGINTCQAVLADPMPWMRRMSSICCPRVADLSGGMT